jgi:hypothetical protein
MGVKSKDRVERKQSFSFNIGSNPSLTTNALLQKEDWTDAKYEENTPLR